MSNTSKINTNEYVPPPMLEDGLWDMSPSTTPPVSEGFKCLICEKSFEQRSSRDRHLRRCRQKQLTGTIPRKKSCNLCTQAKTRCDLQIPACSRCKAKGLDCRYHSPAIAYRDPAAASSSVRARVETSPPTPAATDIGQIDDVDQANIDISLDVAIVDWGEISNSLLDWVPITIFGSPEHEATELELPQAMLPEATRAVNAIGYPPGSIQSRQTNHQSSRLVSLESFLQMRHRLAAQAVSVKGKCDFDKFHFIHLVIRAYPKMMVTGNTPPPFIHSSSLLPGRTPEALAICKGLVEMYRTMTPDNRQFVMKTIAQEHERVLKYISCNELEMLSTLQAALIYGLVRHFEDDPTMDRPTLMQIEAVAFNVGLGGLMARGEIEGTRPVWEEWILAESKRRTMIALYIFDASFHHSRGLQTLTSYELGELPLPTIRDLWEGTDRVAWEIEYERYLAGLKGEKLPRMQDAWASGNLVFGEWYSGMDTFGVTVLALSQSCQKRDR